MPPVATPAPPEASPSPALNEEEGTSLEDTVRIGVLALIALSCVIPWIFVLRRVASLKAESRKAPLRYRGGKSDK